MNIYEITLTNASDKIVDVQVMTSDELQELIELYKERGYEVTYKEVIIGD